MHTLKNWTAKRSGHCMTVNGTNDIGAAVKVAGVHAIRPNAGRVFAENGVGNRIAELLSA